MRATSQIKLVFAVCLAILVSIHLSSIDGALSRVLDPQTESPERSMLSLIQNELDSHGINTVYGKSSDHPLLDGEVRVASLIGFAPRRRAWGTFPKETWSVLFRDGVVGIIAAVPKGPSNLDSAAAKCNDDIVALGAVVCEFVRKWLSTPSDRRIFVAFTREDFDYAEKVQASLEKAGFVVFLYLKGKNQNPWADPAMVGEVFAQAGCRLVIDSANSRGNPGVAVERECCEVLLMPPPPSTPLSRVLAGNG